MSSSRPRKAWAQAVKEAAGFICADCGRQGDSRFHAHHLNGDDTDHRPENGACLCASCHLSRHYAGMNVHHTWTKTAEELTAIARKRIETQERNGTRHRTTCRRGLHEFTPENTYRRRDGQRECRACREIGKRRRMGLDTVG